MKMATALSSRCGRLAAVVGCWFAAVLSLHAQAGTGTVRLGSRPSPIPTLFLRVTNIGTRGVRVEYLNEAQQPMTVCAGTARRPS